MDEPTSIGKANDQRLSDKKRKLVELCPILSHKRLIIKEKKVGGGPFEIFSLENFWFVFNLVSKELVDDAFWCSEVTFWTNIHKLYQLKCSWVGSRFDYANSDCGDLDCDPFFGGYEYYSDDGDSDGEYGYVRYGVPRGVSYIGRKVPNYTYIAIVEANNIHNFMRKSMEMEVKGYGIDPLEAGDRHDTEVYVHSPTTIPPIGFSDLLERSATVYLVINEEVVDEFIEKNN